MARPSVLEDPVHLATYVSEFELVQERIGNLPVRKRSSRRIPPGRCHPYHPISSGLIDKLVAVKLSPADTPATTVVSLNKNMGCTRVVDAAQGQYQVGPLAIAPVFPKKTASLSQNRVLPHLPRVEMFAIPELKLVVLAQIASLGDVGSCVRIALPLGVRVARDTPAKPGEPVPGSLLLRRWRQALGSLKTGWDGRMCDAVFNSTEKQQEEDNDSARDGPSSHEN